MSNILQENLDKILSDKKTNLLSSNLKENVTCLGIEGTLKEVNNQDLEITKNGIYTADDGYTGLGNVTVNVDSSSSGDVKLFETIEDMNNSTGNNDGDLALVYKNTMENVTSTVNFSTFICPKTVVLDKVLTEGYGITFKSTDSSQYPYIHVGIDTMFVGIMVYYDMETFLDIYYQSDDAQTYTRMDTIGNPIMLNTSVVAQDGYEWYDTFGKFIQVGDLDFEGLYEYLDGEWELANTQLTSDASTVYSSTFYGKNGIETGTLGMEVSTTLDDNNAILLGTLANIYRNMDTIVVTNDNFTSVLGQDSCAVIPSELSVDSSGLTKMNSMFSNCSSLMYANINNWDTSNVSTMAWLFGNDESLEYANINTLTTNQVTDVSYMFYNCPSLTKIDISNFCTDKITNMNYMFYNCSKLTGLNLTNFNTSNVMTMIAMFRDSGIINLDLTSFDTSNVTDMSNMFYGCADLQTIDMSGCDTSKVTNMRYMFGYCSSLIELDISNMTFDNVTTYNYMFSSCKALETVYVKDSSAKTFIDNRLSDVGLSITSTIKE